jgi:hypothetical protein
LLLACTPLEDADDRFEAAAGTGGTPMAGTAGAGAIAGEAARAGSGGASGGSKAQSGSASAGEGGAGTSAGVAGGGESGGNAGRGGEAGESGAGGDAAPEGCPPLDERDSVELGPGETVIDRDTEWDCENVRVVAGTLLVAPGTALTIEPGSVVRFARGGLLLVQRRGRLVASGTAQAPIVFTSALPPGEREPGDWRGVVLIGDGPSHAVNAPVYNTLSDGRADYGGGPEGDAAGSCGELRYVRVEFAGGNLDEAANPGAALTLAGCGAGTSVDYVQVHRATDGVGLVGGTAGLMHLVVTANARGDSIEWTGGYRGDLQFLVAQSLGAATGLLGSNSENDPARQPVSAPRIYNALVAGSAPLVGGAHFGMALQFGSGATLKNSVIVGFADAAFDLRLPEDMLENEVGAGRAVDVSHILLDGNTRSFTANAEVLATMPSLRMGDPGLLLATDRTAPSFLPTNTEVLIEPVPVPQPFDTTAAFRGAMPPGGVDWTRGWTAFPSD